jgi:hypothetical protein
MKKLTFIVAAIAASMTASAVVYDGESYLTKAQAPNTAPYVHPTNIVSIFTKQLTMLWEAYQPPSLAGINVFNSTMYPSSIHGSFNIGIGIDHVIGDPLQEPGKTKYSVAIGTSDRASGMHSYVFGSQANSLANNSTVIGYGATSTSEWSTVIGHGKRPSASGVDYDKNFANEAAMIAWLKTYDPNAFRGIHFMNNETKKLYTVTEVSSTPYVSGYYYKFIETNPEVKITIPKGKKLTACTVYYTNNTAGVAVQCIVPAGKTYTTKGTEFFLKNNDTFLVAMTGDTVSPMVLEHSTS